MGTVYEAEQTEPVRRRVALKVMKAGRDSKEVVARFEAERHMSPEQAEMSNLDVDTRTDVDSLGVLLHELLVGELPVDPAALGLHQFIAQLVVRETETPRPSTRVSTMPNAARVAELRPTDSPSMREVLRGDLDWIMLKAMEKDRTRRCDPSAAGGREVSARELLDSGAAKVRNELTDRPLIQAQLMSTIGEAYYGLRQLDVAEPLIEAALATQVAQGAAPLDVARTKGCSPSACLAGHLRPGRNVESRSPCHLSHDFSRGVQPGRSQHDR
jgi:hypothetical protein